MYERSAAQNKFLSYLWTDTFFLDTDTGGDFNLNFRWRLWNAAERSRLGAGCLFSRRYRQSPNTLVPLISALAFGIDDFDEKVSDWAVKYNPVFGSEDNARDASDYLRAVLQAEAAITALTTPSGDVPEQWMVSKAKGFGVELAAIGSVGGLTDLLKDSTGRTRPDGSSDRSFPSSHTSGAFSYMTLVNRNIDSIDMPLALKPPLKIGNYLLASGVGWARVEGRRHYPSDVLAGAALGHFLTAFIHDAFMNLPEVGNADVVVFPVKRGAGMALVFRF